MLMAAIILFGWISFQRLGVSQLPDVDFPVVSVSLSLPGAAPEIVESQVLDPIEDAIMEIDGIRNVTSSAQQASGSIAVEFELNRDIDESMQQIQNKINQVQNLLPTGLFPPTLRKSNPEDQPIMWLAVTTDDPNVKPIDLMIYSRNVLFDQFATLSGVGNIALGGYVDPALRVWADVNKMDELNLTSDDLLQSIYDGHLETPSGSISDAKSEYNLRLMGEADSPTEFGKLMINSRASAGPNYQVVRMSQIGQIEEGISDVRKIARNDKKRTVGLGILKQHGSNAVEVGNLVRKKLDEVRLTLPKGWHIDIRTDNTRFIKQSVDELLFTLCLSALLTSIVCYLFLGSITSTLNVLMAIPTSIIGAFTAFFFFHFTLNTFTLLGLSLAIGIVVDDAIMMLENIVRHREMGQKMREAALNGATEITFAALAATIAVVAIFLPVVFMQGVIGRYFLQYGITVTVAVLLSLLEALTLTPMRCSRYLKVDHHPKGLAAFVNTLFHHLANFYTKILEVLLNNRWKTVAVATFVFLGSFYLARLIPAEMMPAQDQSMFLLRFKLPVGTALPVTDRTMGWVEDYLLKQPEIDGVFSAVGGFGGDAVNQGMAFVTLVDRDKRKLSQGDLIKKYRKELYEVVGAKQKDWDTQQAALHLPPGTGLPEGVLPPGTHEHEHEHGKEDGKLAHGEKGGRSKKITNLADAIPGETPRGADAVAAAAKIDTQALAEAPTGAPSPAASGAVAGASTDDSGGHKRGGGGKKGGVEIIVQDLSLRGFAATRGFPVEFIIQGPDWDKLTELTSKIMDKLRDSKKIVDVNTDIQPNMPEAQLTPNRSKLAAHAIQLNTLTGVINALVGGAILDGKTMYPKNGHRYEIELRLVAGQRDKVPDLQRIKFRNNRGEVVPLSELVDVNIRPSLMLISRLNRVRAITVYGNPAPGVSQQDAMDLTEKVAKSMLPGGYSLKMIGSSQSFKESFQSLIWALLLGIIVSYMVLASQFNSFIHPITVLMALPFSFSGAFLGLLIGHQSINIYSLIGFILLMGIVKKNSILLVDFTNQIRDTEHVDVHTALIKACPVRLRPILMTSIAVVAGSLPEALDIGPGAETTIPMAIAIIGGTIASTLLTLFIVPCVYSLLSKLENREPVEKAHTTVAPTSPSPA
jgi:multidrug efflux pump subunit AcrB